MTAVSPFVFDVGRVLREGAPEPFSRVGDAPERIGAEMIAVEQGAEVRLDGVVTPLGGGVLIDADVRALMLAAPAAQLEVRAAALEGDRLLIGAAELILERLAADPLR